MGAISGQPVSGERIQRIINADIKNFINLMLQNALYNAIVKMLK